MSDALERIPEREQIVLPGTGEVVDLSDDVAVGQALKGLRDFKQLIQEADDALCAALVERSRTLGTKTLHMHGPGLTVTVGKGTETTYDAEAIEEQLRQVGMPEERIREVVVETVSHRVDARKAAQAAAANPTYRAIIEANKMERERKPSVGVKRD